MGLTVLFLFLCPILNSQGLKSVSVEMYVWSVDDGDSERVRVGKAYWLVTIILLCTLGVSYPEEFIISIIMIKY